MRLRRVGVRSVARSGGDSMKPSRRDWRAALAACALVIVSLATGHVRDAPRAEAGDAQLRFDMEVLAAVGLIDNVMMQWPIPWGGVLASLERVDGLENEPGYVRAVTERVEERARQAVQVDHAAHHLSADFTNLSDDVRGFDALGREYVQGSVSSERIGCTTAVRIQPGTQRRA